MVKKMTNKEMEALLKSYQKKSSVEILIALVIKWSITVALVFGSLGLAIAAVTWVAGMLV